MPAGRWGFLTNHGHVLLALSRNPELRQREIAQLVGITEGAVHRIVIDLCEGGYVATERVGRRNRYQVNAGGSLRHPIEAGHTVGELLESLAAETPTADSRAAGPSVPDPSVPDLSVPDPSVPDPSVAGPGDAAATRPVG